MHGLSNTNMDSLLQTYVTFNMLHFYFINYGNLHGFTHNTFGGDILILRNTGHTEMTPFHDKS